MLDLYRCDLQQISDTEFLKQTVVAAMNEYGLHGISDCFCIKDAEEFAIVSMFIGGHVILHAYPTKGFVAVDVFSCFTDINAEKVALSIKTKLDPDTSKMTYLQRATSATDMKPRRKTQTKPLRQVKQAGEKVFRALTNKRSSRTD